MVRLPPLMLRNRILIRIRAGRLLGLVVRIDDARAGGIDDGDVGSRAALTQRIRGRWICANNVSFGLGV